MSALRKSWSDWVDGTPRNAVEICAAISVLSLDGQLSAADEEHIAAWLAFRKARASSAGDGEHRVRAWNGHRGRR